MAISPTLLSWEPTFKWKNHLYPRCPPHASFPRIKIRKNLKNLSIKCFFTTAANTKRNECLTSGREISKHGLGKMETKQNPIEIVAKTIVKVLLKSAAATVLVGLLLMYNPYNNNSALAASGGRMGGRSFSSRSSGSSSRLSSSGGGISELSELEISLVFAYVVLRTILIEYSKDTEETSVLKLQVGLMGSARSLQKDLNRIAETADTSTPEGLHYVLTESVLALLRYPDYCIFADSYVDVKKSMEEGEKRFNQLSIEERGKFDEETLVNVNNIKKQSTESIRADGCGDGYIVITILVAAKGGLELPTINNSNDLKEALQKMASIPSRRTLAAEVLWTPQKEDDTLSEQQLLQDYPLLRPL